MAADEESLPFGVFRRRDTEKLYFEVRSGLEKFYSTKIRTPEEGGLCYDIARLYSERSDSATRLGAPNGERRKRKAPLELNYPDYSPSLLLEDLPRDFNVRDNKEGAMEIILKQARAAAMGLPKQVQAAAKRRAKGQKQPAHDVGSQSIGNRISSQQSVHCASCGAKEHPDFAGLHRGNCVQKFFAVCEHFNRCKLEYTSKVIEREELEQKVKDIKEDSGIISFRKPGSDKFHEHMACIKQLVGSDGRFPPFLETFEQKYMSEESECCKLRKRLEDHNLKSIPESLTDDGNKRRGFQRPNENEMLPPALEIYPTEELNSCNVPPEVGAPGGLPANPLVPVVMPQGENDIAVPSVLETDISQPVASHTFALGDELPNEELQDCGSSLLTCPMENEDERPTEVCVDNNDDWINDLFNVDPDDILSCDFRSFPEGSMCRPQV